MLISVDQLEESAKRFAALEKKPVRENLSNFSDEALIADVSPEIIKGNILGADENLAKRKKCSKLLSRNLLSLPLKELIGKNDSVYSNFV
ncbi:MAG: hypothetical protein WKG06_24840 [Segetibacter sp.]